MLCPECNNKTRVTDSRVVEDVVVRKRKCTNCKNIFYTEEIEVFTGDTLKMFYSGVRENKKRQVLCNE